MIFIICIEIVTRSHYNQTSLTENCTLIPFSHSERLSHTAAQQLNKNIPGLRGKPTAKYDFAAGQTAYTSGDFPTPRITWSAQHIYAINNTRGNARPSHGEVINLETPKFHARFNFYDHRSSLEFVSESYLHSRQRRRRWHKYPALPEMLILAAPAALDLTRSSMIMSYKCNNLI